ncbi:MAG TPA: POTRA domain-containing protein [Candidatus Acidoferrales bacterium]|nr:POTRA domain-containing protein [Candidatus Acidoferrales bacterium]
MPISARFKPVLATLTYFLGSLLLANSASAQSKSETRAQNVTPAELPTVVVDAVKIEGGTELTADEKTSIANSLQGETSHSDWLDRLKANATRQLLNHGFLDGTSDAKVEPIRLLDGKEHVAVLLALTAGPRYSIQTVWWSGASIFSTAQLGNVSLLRVGDVFRTSTLRDSESLLRQAFANRGYNQTVVTLQLQKHPETGKIAIYIHITEGLKSVERKPLQCKQYSAEDIQKTPYVPSLTYDPKIDGQMQIARAQLEAQHTNKKLLLIVGDNSCGWCHLLDQTFQRNPATTAMRDKIFIALHVDVSEDNANECALRAYPKAPGIPFIYVLDADGKLLGTEDAVDWESSDGYDPQRIETFLKKW